MPRTSAAGKLPAFRQKPFDFDKGLQELDKFFQEKDPVHKTMRRLVKRLEKAKIPYAVVGGMAVFAHEYRRATNDVDVLLTREGFEAFRQKLVPRDYDPVPGRPRRFLDRTHQVTIDVLVTGAFPGTGKPGPITYPDPQEVSERRKDYLVVTLATLIQMKLAARRYRDFGDVVELIRFNNLDESFADRLHPSVRQDYVECLEEKRREDEYEAREG
jgi:hypothetical protein